MVLAPWAVDLHAHLGSQNPKAILDIMVRDALDETGENFLRLILGRVFHYFEQPGCQKCCSMPSAQQLVCFAKPSMKSYWLRWASSAMTTMLRRSESSGNRSPFSSGTNFWIVVKTTPPERDRRAARADRRGRSACTGVWRSRSVAAGEGAEELVVEVVAVGQHDERRVLHRRVEDELARRRKPSSGSCRSPACARRRRRAGRPRGATPRRCASTALLTAWNWW